MTETYTDWRHYQEETARFFRESSCTAEIEATIHGPHAQHKVDVWVTFLRHGIQCKWVIECKLWNHKVTKEKVMALKAIVDDVGADRGIIITEKGFQSGAYAAARGKNITLVTSLEEFRRTALAALDSQPLLKATMGEGACATLYTFPGKDQPQSILSLGDRLIVGNWGTGRIAIVDSASKSVLRMISLDKYEQRLPNSPSRIITSYPPGSMAVADGKLFVGQVFSEFLLAIDLDTSAIVKRIVLPGGGEGAITASSDGRTVYFASNRVRYVYAIDSATYEFHEIPFPEQGQGSLCVFAHPSRPLLYLGVQRGSRREGAPCPGGNSFLAVYDIDVKEYVAEVYLAELIDGVSDWSIPHSLTLDPDTEQLYVGMFQSRLGICRVDTRRNEIAGWITPAVKDADSTFPWADPLSQALYGGFLLSVNRNNCELAIYPREGGTELGSCNLGKAPNGPKDLVVVDDTAVVGYPERYGLFYVDLRELLARSSTSG